MKMKYTIYALIVAVLFTACEGKQAKLLGKIKAIESSEKIGTKEGLAELAKLHAEYGTSFNDSAANDYLYAAAQYYFHEENKEESKRLLLAYLQRDDSTDRFRNAAINLAKLYADEKEFTKADDLISETLDKSLPTNMQWNDILSIYEAKVAQNKDIKPNDYERIALAYTATGNFEKALENLDLAINTFPNYEQKNDLLYRSGFTAWNYMKNADKAKQYYNLFLEQFPNDERAEEVKTILKDGMLEKSDEEILEILKAKASKTAKK
ncbi:MAG: Outer rane lipoprotein [Bacteroidota bacterium]|jgi:tetratricopeptide (TPR) repeat protein